MTEFIHRLRSILLKLSSNYDKRSTMELSSLMKRWNSSISEATTKNSNDIPPNTPNGSEETKQKNGIEETKEINGIKKSKYKSKSIFDTENHCCLKCRFRSATWYTLKRHIEKKHIEEKEWL